MQALQRLYLAEPGEQGERAVLEMLEAYWHRDRTNEAVVRSLIELLGKQGRYQQAEQCYTKLCLVLEQQEERAPHPRTQAVMDALRVQRVQPRRDEHQPERIAPPPATQPHTLLSASKTIPVVAEEAEMMIDEEALPALGTALVQGVSAFGPLFAQGWSLDMLVDALRIITPIINTIPAITQQTLLQMGMDSFIGNLPLASKRQFTEEEQLHLCQSFSQSCSRMVVVPYGRKHASASGQPSPTCPFAIPSSFVTFSQTIAFLLFPL